MPFKFTIPFPQVAPCVNNTKVDFSWTVTCTDSSAQQKVESSASFQATRYQATLKISQGVLTGGVTCTFNVTGSMNYNPDIKSMVSQDIKALSSPLELAIFGGNVVDVGYWSLSIKSIWFASQSNHNSDDTFEVSLFWLDISIIILSLSFSYRLAINGCLQLLGLLCFGQCDNESQRSVMNVSTVFESVIRLKQFYANWAMEPKPL